MYIGTCIKRNFVFTGKCLWYQCKFTAYQPKLCNMEAERNNELTEHGHLLYLFYVHINFVPGTYVRRQNRVKNGKELSMAVERICSERWKETRDRE